MEMQRRRFIKMAGLGLVGVLLSACVSTGDSASRLSDPVITDPPPGKITVSDHNMLELKIGGQRAERVLIGCYISGGQTGCLDGWPAFGDEDQQPFDMPDNVSIAVVGPVKSMTVRFERDQEDDRGPLPAIHTEGGSSFQVDLEPGAYRMVISLKYFKGEDGFTQFDVVV